MFMPKMPEITVFACAALQNIENSSMRGMCVWRNHVEKLARLSFRILFP